MSNEWYNAVDRELVAIGSTADSFESATAAVAALINWHVQASLDPAVSAEARALRDTYLAERDALRAENERLRILLARYGKHDYVCSSEHGRFPKRCDCWLSHDRGRDRAL